MGKGSSGSTQVVQNNAPPQAFLDAYNQVLSRATANANQPLSQYSGPMVSGFTPDQAAAMGIVRNSQGVAAPYINSAAQEFGAATTPLWNNIQQWSPSAIRQYQSPFTQDVVQQTEAEFANQNAQQQQGIVGNAIQNKAYGGDRAAVAQGITAGQQRLAQAPVIANLENLGFQTAQQEFNQQQQTQLGANEANAWLGSQAGFGLGNLGAEAQNTTLQGANALLGTGGLQQQLQQAQLNIPFEQFMQAQAYPFQTTGWLSNIALGLGSGAGGTGSTTSPGPSAASQVAGLGLTGLAGYGLLNRAGVFGSGSGISSLSGADLANFYPSLASTAASDVGSLSFFHRGGGIRPRYAWGGPIPLARARGGIIAYHPLKRQGGGIVPYGSAVPGETNFVPGSGGLPDLSVSVVPPAPMSGGIPSLMKRNYGTTSNSRGPDTSVQQGIGTALEVAQIAALLKRGGGVHKGIVVPRRYASGGSPSLSDELAAAVASGGSLISSKNGSIGSAFSSIGGNPANFPSFGGQPAAAPSSFKSSNGIVAPSSFKGGNGIMIPLLPENGSGGIGASVPSGGLPANLTQDFSPPPVSAGRTVPGTGITAAQTTAPASPPFSNVARGINRTLVTLTPDQQAQSDALLAQQQRTAGPGILTGQSLQEQQQLDNELALGFLPDGTPIGSHSPDRHRGGIIPHYDDGGGIDDGDIFGPMAPLVQSGIIAPGYQNTYTPRQPSGRADEMRRSGAWEALLGAGLGMMAGSSPFPGINIGRGGLEGLRMMSAANNRASQLEEREAEQADTGAYRKANLDLEVKRFSDSAKEHQDRLKIEADREAQREKHEGRMEDLTQQQRNIAAGNAASEAEYRKGMLNKEEWEPQAPVLENGQPKIDPATGAPLWQFRDKRSQKNLPRPLYARTS